jgi:beta-lactamase class D
MKYGVPFLLCMMLIACGEGPGNAVVPGFTLQQRDDWARIIANSELAGVFVLWEPDSARLQASDTVRANKGFLPASTFKVFNSLVALQTGAVADEHVIIPWDSVVRKNYAWNKSQDMATAIARSTVWWYQEVARRAGAQRMQHWLDTVHYGNATMGDSIHMFWLRGGLRITPVEQVYFMQKLDEERLPFAVEHQRTVKRILPADSTANWHLRGKTGWAIRVQEQYGWYVGWVERGGRTAYFAINIDMRGEQDISKRQALTRALLVKEGWLDHDAL